MEKEKLVPTFSYEKLRDACEESVKTGRNRSVDWKKIEPLLKYGDKYPVVWEMVHNDVEMRVEIAISPDECIYLDIPFDTYKKLDVYRIEEDDE